MSVASSSLGTATQLAPSRPRAFLNIARHGAGPSATYVLTYHRLEQINARPKPAVAEGAQSLIDLLERIGVDFRQKEVRDALEDVLRFGSANIPDLWLSDEEMIEKGLVES